MLPITFSFLNPKASLPCGFPWLSSPIFVFTHSLVSAFLAATLVISKSLLFHSHFQIFLSLVFARSNNNNNHDVCLRKSSASFFSFYTHLHYLLCKMLLLPYGDDYIISITNHYILSLYPIQFLTEYIHIITHSPGFLRLKFFSSPFVQSFSILLHQWMNLITNLSILQTKQPAVFKHILGSLRWHHLCLIGLCVPLK